jgi:hypothetical protein
LGFFLPLGLGVVVVVALVAADVELVVDDPPPQPAAASATTRVIGSALFIDDPLLWLQDRIRCLSRKLSS